MRCQSVNEKGHVCNIINCKAHTHSIQTQEYRQRNIYNLTETEYSRQLAKRIDQKASDPELLSLRKDIGVVQLLIEKILNMCQSDDEFLLRKDELTSLLTRIESLKKTAFTIEKELGNLMTLDEAVLLGQTLLNIVNEVLEHHKADPKIIEEIADRFNDAY